VNGDQEGLTWQIGVWDQISQLYVREIDRRFSSVVEAVINRASLRVGERVLDLGTGTGAVALRAAAAVGAGGSVVGVDISQEMLARARQTTATLDLQNVDFVEGRAEAIPAEPATFDVVLASLSLMYVIDRAAGAREISRVLRPAGRFVAAVWAGAASSDIVLFQQTAGRFAPPPVPGVGPGALADATAFIAQLANAGIDTEVQSEIHGFDFDDFESAWDVLAGVTTAQLAPERLQEAKAAVRELMWPQGDGPKHFHNTTQFIVCARRYGQDPSRITTARHGSTSRSGRTPRSSLSQRPAGNLSDSWNWIIASTRPVAALRQSHSSRAGTWNPSSVEEASGGRSSARPKHTRVPRDTMRLPAMPSRRTTMVSRLTWRLSTKKSNGSFVFVDPWAAPDIGLQPTADLPSKT